MTPRPSVVSASSSLHNAPRARAKASNSVPRLALRVAEAAAALGVSEDAFARHVAPEVKVVRRGAMKLYAVAELEAWLERSGSRVLDEIRP